MVQPLDCPEWGYDKHPNRQIVVPARVAEILVDLRSARIDTSIVASDTRGIHSRVFQELTPPECEYYAGHYRGERFRCLRYCRVKIQSDSRVGVAPDEVDLSMLLMNSTIDKGLKALDTNISLSPKERLRLVIALASHAFVTFLTIHPYVDGNGHAARFIVVSIMGRYGYWLRSWSIEPRTSDPQYLQVIIQYRNGNLKPLELYLAQMVLA
jgi:fido (protein-threonine AMPylation protein)